MSKISKGESKVAISKKKLPLADLGTAMRSDNPCENCYNINFTPQHLDYLDLENEVVQMIRNYKNNQYQNIITPGSMPHVPDDARSVYFSLNKLKSFIYEIENTICESGCNEVLGELGIRFYYGAYNAATPLPGGVDDSYAGKHTLVLVPTYTKNFIDGNPPQHVDFCPDWFNDGCEPASLDVPSTYGTDPTARLSSFPSRKVLALVGGYGDKEIKQEGDNTRMQGISKMPKGTKGTKTSSKKNAQSKARPGGPEEGEGGMVRTLLNHGDIVPPPAIIPGERYRDATLLNC